jgi:hypothetical protein
MNRRIDRNLILTGLALAGLAIVLSGCAGAGAGGSGGGGGGGSDIEGIISIAATTNGPSDITWEVSGSISGDPAAPDYSIAWAYNEPSQPNQNDSVTELTGGALDWSETVTGLDDGTGVSLSYTALATHQASVTLSIRENGTVLAEKTINGTVNPPDP